MLGSWDGARGFRADDTPNRIEVAALPQRRLAKGTRSEVALVRLSLWQSKVRFVSAALNHFLNIIVTSLVGFLLLSALRVTSNLVASSICRSWLDS